MERKYQVTVLPPRDRFDETTVHVDQWLRSCCDSDPWGAFMDALETVIAHPDFCLPFRERPRVGYDIIHDCEYFIFKIDCNGTTFVASEWEIPCGE